MSPGHRRIILDVDTGVDDALAMLMACGSPDLELLGVGCVAGNAELVHVVQNTAAVLALAGRLRTHVHPGADRPLVRPPVGSDEAHVHGGNGRGYAELPTARARVSSTDASQMILEVAREWPCEVTLVTTGPLTNVAVALRREPALPQLLHRLIFMGGAFRIGGNTTPAAEFNIHSDPDAAKAVIDAFAAAPLRPIAVGLDVTTQVRLGAPEIERIAARVEEVLEVSPDGPWGSPRSPLIRFLADALRQYAEFHERTYGFYGVFAHDPLALAVALAPDVIKTQAVSVDIARAEPLTAGATVADWLGVWERDPNVDVAVEVDAVRARDLITERIADCVAGVAERGEAASLRGRVQRE